MHLLRAIADDVPPGHVSVSGVPVQDLQKAVVEWNPWLRAVGLPKPVRSRQTGPMARMGMLSNGGLELGRFGHLTLLAGRLHISANGIDTELPKPWTDSTVAYWLDDQPGNLLIAPTREDHLFRVDLNQLSVEPLGKLQRFKDGGLRRIKLFGHGPDVIPAYELGAVYIEQGLILRWHIHLQTIDWFADSIDDGALWLRSEHGGRVGYRLSDGQPLTNHR